MKPVPDPRIIEASERACKILKKKKKGSCGCQGNGDQCPFFVHHIFALTVDLVENFVCKERQSSSQ